MIRRVWNPAWADLAIVALLVWMVGYSAVAAGQSATVPRLHRRGDTMARQPQTSAVQVRGSSSLPPEASGEYALGAPGEVIEIVAQARRLEGYVSKMGDLESDQGAPLTFFFDRASMSGERLTFSTWQVHGVWFSFDGAIVPGPSDGRSDDPPFVLEGDLVEHNVARQTEQHRRVRLKLAPDNGNG